jgi:hypothetical protein
LVPEEVLEAAELLQTDLIPCLVPLRQLAAAKVEMLGHRAVMAVLAAAVRVVLTVEQATLHQQVRPKGIMVVTANLVQTVAVLAAAVERRLLEQLAQAMLLAVTAVTEQHRLFLVHP